MSVSLQIQAVVYKNEKASLKRAFESMANAVRVNRNTGKELGEVVVSYGDASPEPIYTQEEIAALSEEYRDYFTFRYTFFNENTGYGKGQNLLSQNADADYLLIINPDILVCPRMFSGMLEPFLAPDSEVGIVEARQTPLEHPKEYNRKTLETEWITGACFMIATETFRKVSGFDCESFFLYCEDVDISWRVRLLGKKLIYRPDCVAFHAKQLSATANWQPTAAEAYYSQESALFMAYKWCNRDRFKKLYHRFANGDEIGKRIIAKFEDMKAKGTLPKQLDPDHKVAKFYGDDFAKSRYTY
ncbi:MAG: glycosyltransferase [Clostridia bacterium]|nr:glycosyltransferase [Clostridia bacterium]